MGRGKSRRPGPGLDSAPRRGKHRSIRYASQEEWSQDRPARAPDAPPEILLRKLHLEEAMRRMEQQLRGFAARGVREVLVVHGKGTQSAGGIPVLGPQVRSWCGAHSDLVASWREAPGKWGGAGAIVVTLKQQKDPE
ncbi:hypothetical protein CO151_06510 [bacterium CG_4_9_14_3_um_filter_65_15]|nr:MAG: hypothetical protein CO151_06510 [bacterium CG_4_9_14_3_um_filter_65_15]